jgi:CxxC motif-containing protein
MSIKNLTCIECPIGCEIEVEYKNFNIISVKGNTCPRGKLYAQNEVIMPKRVVTSTVKSSCGKMVAVKTNNPVPKEQIFSVMQKIASVKINLPVKMGSVIIENIVDGVNLIVADDLN